MRIPAAVTFFLVAFAVFTGLTAASVVTESGALTSLNVFVGDGTDNWAGVYGEVSGVQAVGSENPIFEWGSNEARYIYFSKQEPDFNADWSSGNKSLLLEEHPFLKNSTDGVETFNSSMNVSSIYQNQDLTGVPAVLTSNSTGDPHWKTGYLFDGSNGFFVGEVGDGKAFDGKDANYQVLLPENGADGSATSFEIWVELVDS
jgi:hypothetical protein